MIWRRSRRAISAAPSLALRRLHPEAGRTMPQRPQLNPLLKLVLDLGPLVLFFAANGRYGIFAATGVFMAAVLAALLVS
jgi:hypothetical protein